MIIPGNEELFYLLVNFVWKVKGKITFSSLSYAKVSYGPQFLELNSLVHIFLLYQIKRFSNPIVWEITKMLLKVYYFSSLEYVKINPYVFWFSKKNLRCLY